MQIESQVTVLKRIPFRWCFDVFFKNDLSEKLCDTRFIQVETRQEALEIARRFSWLKEIERSVVPNELVYSLVPDFRESS
tara:strand:+ start:455 stop:694 length:240 start_codon:yes stop_codon:yes gene_type:complete